MPKSKKQQHVGARVHLSGVKQGVVAGGPLPAIFQALAGSDRTWDAVCAWAERRLPRKQNA